jgi:hypothetical protein
MRWLRLTIFTWGILVILIAGATQLKTPDTKPNNAQILGFGLCSDKPCFLSITPGVTTWDEAALILSNYSKGKWSLKDNNIIPLVYGYRASIDSAVTSEGTGINTIGVQYRYDAKEFLVIRDFVELFGTPCLVGIPDDPRSLTLIYPYLMIDIVRGRGEQRLNMRSIVPYFQLIDTQARFGTSLDLCTFAKKISFQAVVPWSGFRAWDEYRSYCTHNCKP